MVNINKSLSEEQYRVTQQHGTEPAYSGAYWDKKDNGHYKCICCDTVLFSSKTKYESGTGWPAFYKPISEDVIGKSVDNSFFMQRTEVHCLKCKAHLGHVFPDGPEPTGLRYCINSASLNFNKIDNAWLMLGTTKIYGCLADPIDHVKAPSIFTSIFKSKQINAVMIPIHVNADDLENVVSSLKLIKNFEGMTITIPHKTNIAKLCDYLEPDAKFTGAVNWIKFDNDRKLIGNNFDGQGFVNGFIGQNYSFKNKRVCLFGAGGAAVSIGCALANEQIKSLMLINRDIKKAIDLKNKINAKYNLLKVEIFPESDYSLACSDIIINATSLGLKKTDKLPFDIKNSSLNCVIADIIMQPEETELLKYAKSLGRSIHYGKYMIESQIDLVGNFLKIW